MSGTLISNVQLGDSVTAANNFVMTAEANDGTMKLARGNQGATTQDVMTIATTGKPDFNQLSRLITGAATSAGHLELPSGLIINWGSVSISTSGANTWATANATLNKTFPTNLLSATASLRNAAGLSNQMMSVAITNTNNTSVDISAISGAGAVAGITVTYIVVGY